MDNSRSVTHTIKLKSMTTEAVLDCLVLTFMKDYKRWTRYPEPDDINGDDCALFAYIASKLLKDTEFWYTDYCGGHAFIKKDGRFYDGTHTKGCLSWRQLDNDFKRLVEGQLETLYETMFCNHWKNKKTQAGCLLKSYGVIMKKETNKKLNSVKSSKIKM